MDNSNRGWIVAVVVLLAILLVGPAFGWGMMGPGMMWGWGGATASPWWGIGMLLFWVLVLAGIGLLVTWAFRQTGPGQAAGGRALDLLKERYARGELTREQYEQMRHDLE